MGKRSKKSKEYVRFYKTKEIPMSKKMMEEDKVKLGCGTLFAVLIVAIAALFFTPLILMLTWNLAICALFPALPAMSYWIAFGVNWFLTIIGNKFINTGVSSALDRIKDELGKD